MLMNIVVCIIIWGIGLIIYFVAPAEKPRLAEFGRIVFLCGFLVMVYLLGAVVGIPRR